MTATRWWVQAGARWLARFKTTEGQLRSASLAVTAFSTFSLVLQGFGAGWLVPWVGAAGLVGWTGYSYLFSEGGVYNQTQRDLADIGDNYSGPTMLMDARIEARQLALLAAALQNGDGASVDELEQEFQEVTAEEWAELRDGVDLDELAEVDR